MKKHIVEMNIVRAISIFAVLVIHTTAGPKTDVAWGSLSAPFYLIANQLFMFAVPLFIMMSGLVLFYRYHDEWTWDQAIPFYKKRLQYILIPYLLWSIFYFAFNQFLINRQVVFDVRAFFKLLLWGHTSYHLYFMIIILQYYLVFPPLITVIRKYKIRASHLILLGLLVQSIFFSVHHWIRPIDHVATLMPNYFLVFCTGAAIGMDYQSFTERSKHLWWTFGSAITAGFVYIILLISSKSGSHYWGPLYTVLYNFYAISIGISFIWIAQIVCKRTTKLSKSIFAFGSASFGIYLVHPAILSIWRSVYKPAPQQADYHIYNLASLILIIFIPWLLVRLIKRWKFHWLLFGKS